MLGHRAIGEDSLSSIGLTGGGGTSPDIPEVTTTTARFSSKSFVTRAGDAPAHNYISGRIGAGLRLERRLKITPNGEYGSLILTDFGEVQLRNDDGELDLLVHEFAADGRTLRLKIGATEFDPWGYEDVQAYSSFELVYTAAADVWNADSDIVRLKISNLANTLNDRLQSQTYAGTGGAEGTAELTGRTKPVFFGRVRNISAQLVDPFILMYQINAGRMHMVREVYDSGIPLTFHADYLTYGTLAAATVPAGSYSTSLEAGFIKLGIAPVGQVTVDARGHRDLITGNYIESTADICRTILRDFGLVPNSLIDNTSFTAVTTARPDDVGLFLPAGDESTVLEVVERIALGGGCFVGQGRDGRFRMQRLEPPGTEVHWAFTDRDIISIQRQALPYRVPWKSWRVAYDNNWTIQTDADLAGGVSQTMRQYLKSRSRYAFAQDLEIALVHLTSTGITRDSLFEGPDDALLEAQRLIKLYNIGRAVYRVVVKNALFSVEIGQTVQLQLDRWDLAAGKKFIVVGIEDDADRVETALTCFG